MAWMEHDPLVLDAMAGAVDRAGRAWNGYELRGLEHVPRDRPFLLVMYHGLVPLDGWYLLARLYREHGLHVRALADRWLFRVPGLARWCRAAGAVPASPGSALELLQEGHPVLVSPGGVREAIAGRARYYRVTWGQRRGFARLALAASVPVLPVFGENVEELYRAPLAGSAPLNALYERTRLPLVPVVGLGLLPFPVRVRTWIGPAVLPRPGEGPQQLRERVEASLQALIDDHQPGRPRLLRGLVDRWRSPWVPFAEEAS